MAIGKLSFLYRPLSLPSPFLLATANIGDETLWNMKGRITMAWLTFESWKNNDGSVKFRAQRNRELGEYRVSVERNGKHNEDQTHYTDDKRDCLDTMEDMIKRETMTYNEAMAIENELPY